MRLSESTYHEVVYKRPCSFFVAGKIKFAMLPHQKVQRSVTGFCKTQFWSLALASAKIKSKGALIHRTDVVLLKIRNDEEVEAHYLVSLKRRA